MKKILSVAAVSLLCTSALASDVNVAMKGAFDFQYGYNKQSKLVKKQDQRVSANQKNHAFDTDSALMAEISASKDGVNYGGRVVVKPTARRSSSASYSGSHLFVEHSAGRLELGNDYNAASKMQVTGYNIAAATGDDWSNYVNDFNGNGSSVSYLTTVDYFVDNFKSKDGGEASRKITYFTPEVYGLTLGVSYVPDTANLGDGDMNAANSTVGIKQGDFGRNMHVKNAFAGGASWKYDMSNMASLQIAATGEYGKPAEKKVNGKSVRKLSSYNLGAKVKYNQFSVAGSYGTWNKSLELKNPAVKTKATKFYTAAVAYNQGPVGASVAMFDSKHQTNKLRAITVGTDYKLMPGLKPYAEVTYFTARPGKDSKALGAKKTNGTVAILGAKLQF